MPLPFILAGAAIVAAGFGAKKGYDGYQDASEAKDITKIAQNKYECAKKEFDLVNSKTEICLEELGNLQLQIGKDFGEFKKLADELLKKINATSKNKDFSITLPQNKLDKIADLSMSATAYLGKLAIGAGAGTAAAYAVYGGVMALAAASTGTPIAALSGAAAYNAAMAAIGGGSLAAGGFGMAGGAMILGGVVAAPIAAIAGWAYASHAEEALKNANKYNDEVNKATKNMNIGIKQLKEVKNYVKAIYRETNQIYGQFASYFEYLKATNTLLERDFKIEQFEDKLLLSIENGYSLAAILTDIITTPIFKPKKDINGEIIIKNNMIEIEIDKNGLQVINSDEIDKILSISSNNAKKYSNQ